MSKLHGIDPHVLIDALTVVMGSEEKEFCVPSTAALKLVLKTATSVLGNKERVSPDISCLFFCLNVYGSGV